MHPDLSHFRNAIARLGEGLEEYRAGSPSTLIRDGLIQRFEFTYDLAPKMLRRVLAATADSPSDIDKMTFTTLMRTAFEQGLVDATWPRWLDHRDTRNTTSHVYSEEKAIEVVEAIPMFLDDARALLNAFERFTGA